MANKYNINVSSAHALHIRRRRRKVFIVKHHSRHLDSSISGSFLLLWIHMVAVKLTRELLLQIKEITKFSRQKS